MSFRLVPNSMTLNDLERRNSPNGCVISPNSVNFWADYVKVIKDTPVLFAAEMQAEEFSFQRYITIISYYDDIGRGSALARALKALDPLSLGKKLTYNQP